MKNPFGKTNKPRIYSIEINDEKINGQIGKVLAELEKHLSDFKKMIERNELFEKEDEAKDLLKAFLLLSDTTQALAADVEKIQNIELQEKEYLKLNDELFLEDKKRQLDIIRENIDSAITIIKERPSLKEYKKELLRLMIKKVDAIKAALERLREDDEKLNEIYTAISNV